MIKLYYMIIYTFAGFNITAFCVNSVLNFDFRKPFKFLGFTANARCFAHLLPVYIIISIYELKYFVDVISNYIVKVERNYCIINNCL